MRKAVWWQVVFMIVLWVKSGLAAEVYAKPDQEFLVGDLQEKYDDIRIGTLRFLDSLRSPVTGLVQSYKGSSLYYYIPADNVFEKGAEPYLDNQAYTYDLATAIMIYTACGEINKAKRIIQVLQKEFYRQKNGQIGLLTSYRCDRFADDGALIMGDDGDRVHVGPNMWVALACLQYIRITGDGAFFPLVVDMAKWASTLPHYQYPDGQPGAVSMGSGWGPDWSQVYSTENCKDYYSILVILSRMYSQCSDNVKKIFSGRKFTDLEMRKEMAGLERWFKDNAYNKENGGFYCGYNEAGLDTCKALDTVSNSISVVGPEKLKKWGIDPYKLINFAEKNLWVKDTIKGQTVEGFDFTVPEEIGNPRRRLIWIEGTAQMVLAYKIMSKYSAAAGNVAKAKEYKEKAIKFSRELDRIAELINLPEQALPYVTYNPGDQEKIITFRTEWEIPRAPAGRWVGSIASTAWRFFSLTYYNPMMMGSFSFCFE